MGGVSRLTIIRGAPGSGKSTLAAAMVSAGLADIHLEADMFFTAEDGSYSYDKSRIAEAHKWCLRQAADALIAGKRVIVSNTFTRAWEMAPYLALGNPQIIRCEGRFANVHGVPDAKVAEMRDRMEPAAIRAAAEAQP
jgi:predicted kinase